MTECVRKYKNPTTSTRFDILTINFSVYPACVFCIMLSITCRNQTLHVIDFKISAKRKSVWYMYSNIHQLWSPYKQMLAFVSIQLFRGGGTKVFQFDFASL